MTTSFLVFIGIGTLCVCVWTYTVFTCGPGEFCSLNSTCLPCPENTYNNMTSHTMKSCFKCPKVDPDVYEVELAPCTKTTPSVIGCEPPYDRVRDLCKPRAHQTSIDKPGVTTKQPVAPVMSSQTSAGDIVLYTFLGLLGVGLLIAVVLLLVLYLTHSGPWRANDHENNSDSEASVPMK